MPTLNPKTDAMTSSSFSVSKHLQHESQFGKIFQMKDFPLIRHIDALKCAAHAPLIFPEVNNNQTAQKNIESTLHLNGSNGTEQFEAIALKSRPQSSSWTIDPSSVPGNLRKHSETKPASLTLEDFLSRGSSVNGKFVDDGEEHLPTEKSHVKARRKQSKSPKRRPSKHKVSEATHIASGDKHMIKSPFNTLSHVVQSSQSNSQTTCDSGWESFTAKGVKFHEKVNNSNINVKVAPYIKKSCVTSHHKSPSQAHSSPARTSLNQAVVEYSTCKKTIANNKPGGQRKSSKDEDSKPTKVFLSEKQSGVLSDCGMTVPCAPPATPTPDQLRRYEYVPSLQDIRAQRSIRQRLQILESRAQKKDKVREEENSKAERLSMREKRIELKKKQRQEIYALNKVMTDLENERFLQFMRSFGSDL